MVSRRITRQSVFRVSSSQVSCRHGEETFVLQVDSGRYLGMDSVGTTIWEFLQTTPRTFEQIRDYVLQEFDITVEECEAGVLDMLQELLANGLLDIDDSPDN